MMEEDAPQAGAGPGSEGSGSRPIGLHGGYAQGPGSGGPDLVCRLWPNPERARAQHEGYRKLARMTGICGIGFLALGLVLGLAFDDSWVWGLVFIGFGVLCVVLWILGMRRPFERTALAMDHGEADEEGKPIPPDRRLPLVEVTRSGGVALPMNQVTLPWQEIASLEVEADDAAHFEGVGAGRLLAGQAAAVKESSGIKDGRRVLIFHLSDYQTTKQRLEPRQRAQLIPGLGKSKQGHYDVDLSQLAAPADFHAVAGLLAEELRRQGKDVVFPR